MTSVNIPASVTSMSGNPYAGCTGIQTATLDQGNSDYVMVDGAIYDKTMYTLVYYPASLTAETVELPETVQEFAPGAFAGSQIKYLDLPSRITQIPAEAFRNSALERITFHYGVTSVGDYAFAGCKNLNDVSILNSIKYLGNYAFADCTSLSNFTFEDIPSGAVPYTIGQHFFDGCTSITQVILPNDLDLTTEEKGLWPFIDNKNDPACIPSYMFANTGIVYAVIPSRITDLITAGVFYGCKDLQQVTFEASKLQGKALGQYFFYGCSSLKEITIPSGLSSPFRISSSEVLNATFAECTSLEKVTINIATYSYVDSGYATFYNCSSLKTIEIWKNTGDELAFNNIREDAFYGCTSLKEIPVYKTVTFEDSAFDASGMETLIIKGSKVTFQGNAPFENSNLKEVFIGVTSFSGMKEETFTGFNGEVNVYFYNLTKEEVIEKAGNSAWFDEADENVHFYFKDTMPEGVEVPEEDDSGSGSGGGGGLIPIKPLL